MQCDDTLPRPLRPEDTNPPTETAEEADTHHDRDRNRESCQELAASALDARGDALVLIGKTPAPFLRWLERRHVSPADAEDVLSEAVERILRSKRPIGEPPARVVAWRHVRCALLDHLRGVGRSRAHEVGFDDSADLLDDRMASPEELCALRQHAQVVIERADAALSDPMKRDILTLLITSIGGTASTTDTDITTRYGRHRTRIAHAKTEVIELVAEVQRKVDGEGEAA